MLFKPGKLLRTNHTIYPYNHSYRVVINKNDVVMCIDKAPDIEAKYQVDNPLAEEYYTIKIPTIYVLYKNKICQVAVENFTLAVKNGIDTK